ncbi:hypothetical protein ASPCAL11826 [Aspergillus calidoustus]|uniref:Uncharacterized protein n=1 Tax=Aspergillus calidoustus TaxID=454130 RepID=A0A0U5CF19_ASPCI|nr:hypothetical protein ASPCAL11826 [Aspergillus calidoustus]
MPLTNGEVRVALNNPDDGFTPGEDGVDTVAGVANSHRQSLRSILTDRTNFLI